MEKDKQWTFRRKEEDWENDSFNTKKEAINAACNSLKNEKIIYVGQLHWSEIGSWYDVKNQEKVRLYREGLKSKYTMER